MTLRQADFGSPVGEVQVRPQPQPKFRQDIEGLRAVAVLAVVLFHAGVPGVGGGFIGVDVFFVISGFLITGLLWREANTTGTVRLPGFYGARARRLLPASAAVGVATAIGSAVLLPPMQARSVIGDGIASALYVGNYRFAMQHIDYLAAAKPPSPFQHYWSLGVEEQFYLVWPATIIGTAWLIRLVLRRTRAQATSSASPYLLVLGLVAAVSFSLSLVATHAWPSWAFFSLPTRAWELAVGGMVALTANTWRRLGPLPAAIAGWTGLAVIVITCIRLSTSTPYPHTAALLPVFGTALVICAGCAAPSQGCGLVLSLPPMRAVGRVSYSWYLWHWPVLLLAPAMLGHPLQLTERVVAAAVSLALAVLTLVLIENPVRFTAPVRGSATGSLLVGAAATAIAVCTGIALLVVVPLPVGRGAPAAALRVTAASLPVDSDDAAVQHVFAQVQAAVALSADLKAVPSNLDPPLADTSADERDIYLNGCLRNFLEVGQPECVASNKASTTTVVLVGDSHAAMWEPAFRQVAVQRHWRLETLAKVNCPLQDLAITSSYLRREYTECEQWRGQIMARLQAEHPRLIVLDVRRRYGPDFGFSAYDPAWLAGLGHTVARLRSIGATVLVLGPIPDPHTEVPTCLSVHLDDPQDCAPRRSEAVNDGGITAERTVTTTNGGHYADLTALFCTAERCPVIVGNDLVFFDDNHVTMAYAQTLSPVIGALADRALAGR